MNLWRWTVLGLACLAAVGCRTNPAVTALERENRDLEDEIYRLQDVLDRTQDNLDKCRRGSAPRPQAAPPTLPLRVPLREPSDSAAAPAGRMPAPVIRGPELTPLDPKQPPPPESLNLPQIEVPRQPLPAGQVPRSLMTPGSSAPTESKGTEGRALPLPSGSKPAAPATPGKLELPGPLGTKPGSAAAGPPRNWRVELASAQSLPATADSGQVDRLTLNRSLCGGIDMDQQAGDDGLLVMIEPRNPQGQLVAAAAPISVVLLDGNLPADEARVARWDLSAEETASRYRRTSQGEGFYLELPWPEKPPANSHLHLFVRYTACDGRNLETQREIDLALPNKAAEGWKRAGCRRYDGGRARDMATEADLARNAPRRTRERPGATRARDEFLRGTIARPAHGEHGFRDRRARRRDSRRGNRSWTGSSPSAVDANGFACHASHLVTRSALNGESLHDRRSGGRLGERGAAL